jgi:hypothetical protein
VSIFIDPFDVGGWRLVLVLMTLGDGSHIHRCPRAPVATPQPRCCLFGTTELPDEVGVAHWIIYVWMSILSIVIMALYTSVMSQILLLNTIKVDTFAKAYDQGAEISVTRDVAEQLTSAIHRLRWLSMAAPYRRREGRARELTCPCRGRCRL